MNFDEYLISINNEDGVDMDVDNVESAWNHQQKEIDKLKVENEKLESIMISLRTQRYGLKNHWAGRFNRCPIHEYTYAVGGNWKTESCPDCEIDKVLKGIEE